MGGSAYYLDDPPATFGLNMPDTSFQSAVPTFYLYGEPQRQVEEGFVHVESLDDRSRPSEWTIHPHVHRNLHQMILIAGGGGAMRAEAEEVQFDAPCLLLIPAGIIHGFTWHRESRGWVITVADSYLHDLMARDSDLAALFHHPRALPLSAAEGEASDHAAQQIAQELSWSGKGRRAAIDALLLAHMVRALRSMKQAPEGTAAAGRQAALVARLRTRIERRFRLREPVSAHARALGVSETALRHACARVAGNSPAAMLDERALLEARRLLLYSNLTIAEIAFAIGFDDPAYFSRFFSRHTGLPPRLYRERS